MIFASKVNATVAAMFQTASANAARIRKEEASKRLDFYQDAQLDHLRALLAAKFSEPGKLTPAFVNIVRKIINALAMTYLEPPKRDVEGTDSDQEIFQEIAQSTGLDGKMKLASRYAKLVKTVMVRPVWRGGKLDLDLITPDILDVECGESPEGVTSVLITHYGTSAKVDEVTYSLWTADEFKRLDYRGNTLTSEPNIYGVIPFLPVWDRIPTDSFWCTGGDDLISLQEAVNLKLTDLMYTLEHQAFGVGWIEGMPGAGKLRVDPGHMVLLPSGGKLGYANTNAPIDEVVAAIDKLVKWAAVSNGLPASSLSTEPTDESGLSKLVSNRELDELRRDDVALFRRYEGQLFDLMRTVWNAHNPTRKLSDKAKLKVDFYDPKPQMSANEQAQAWERLLDLGVISAVDVALEKNPDLQTRENALAYLLKIQDERAQLEEKQL